MPMMDEVMIKRIEDNSFLSPSGCWEWALRRDQDGYGRASIKGKTAQAHRVSFVAFGGVLEAGLEIDHKCRNRACVNPGHLEQTTHRTNVLRGNSPAALHAVKTMCPHGHEYNEENTYYWEGRRICRKCWNKKS